jgi:hypothetical protein
LGGPLLHLGYGPAGQQLLPKRKTLHAARAKNSLGAQRITSSLLIEKRIQYSPRKGYVCALGSYGVAYGRLRSLARTHRSVGIVASAEKVWCVWASAPRILVSWDELEKTVR